MSMAYTYIHTCTRVHMPMSYLAEHTHMECSRYSSCYGPICLYIFVHVHTAKLPAVCFLCSNKYLAISMDNWLGLAYLACSGFKVVNTDRDRSAL